MNVTNNIFEATFGNGGTAMQFFGSWWLVGLFLLLLFIVFLTAYRVSVGGIITFITLGLLTISSYSIFVINEQISQTILFIMFIYVGYMVYIWFNR